MTKLIIFDWDDVFTQGSKKGYYTCYQEAIKAVGISFSPEEEDRRIKARWGNGHVAQIEELVKERPELFDEALRICEENLYGDTFVNCLSLVPGSIELLNRFKGKYILTIATGLHPEILQRVMKKFNVPSVFDQIVTSYDVEKDQTKPDPYIANLILKTQNILPDEAILVGDAEGDVKMAMGAGVTPVVVLTGHLNQEEAINLGVKSIIKDVTHLESVL